MNQRLFNPNGQLEQNLLDKWEKTGLLKLKNKITIEEFDIKDYLHRTTFDNMVKKLEKK